MWRLLWAGCVAACLGAQTRVQVLGSGTPRADPDRQGPAVVVLAGETPILFDAGVGVVRRAAAAKLAPRTLERVFLTHLHSDHTMGLPDLLFSPWILGRKTPLEVYGPAGARRMMSRIEQAWATDVRLRVEGLEKGNPTGHRAVVREIRAGTTVVVAGLKVTAFGVKHGSWPEAFAYRVEGPDRRIVISGDCAPSPAVIEACAGCDVLLHEVYSLKDEAQQEAGWRKYLNEFHTSTAELAGIAARARPKLLVLYHQLYEKGATDEELLAEVTRPYKGRVVSARDLDIY